MHFRRRCAASTIRVTPAMKFILLPENHSCVDIHFGALGGGVALKGLPCSPKSDGMREIGDISMGFSWERKWRRRRDSNSRSIAAQTLSKRPPSTTRPRLRKNARSIIHATHYLWKRKPLPLPLNRPRSKTSLSPRTRPGGCGASSTPSRRYPPSW